MEENFKSPSSALGTGPSASLRTGSSPFVFFGTPDFSTIILDELKQAGFLPALMVTAPDAPQGRKLILTESAVKTWARNHHIPAITPHRIDQAAIEEIKKVGAEFFVVAAYGKILPQSLLDLPLKGTLNVHPSLLPKFRGPSPIESFILSDEKETGVSIMLLDALVDHGPVLVQETVAIGTWPPRGSDLTVALAHAGGRLLGRIIPEWIAGKIEPTPQEHDQATFTKKITKDDGLIDLSGDPIANVKKIRAFDEWRGAYFFSEHKGRRIRVLIKDATVEDEKLTILRVIPEGKKEMDYQDFLRGLH